MAVKREVDPKRQLIQAMKEYRQDFLKFVKEQLNADPTSKQKEIINDIENNRRISCKAGHGVGKTAVAAWALIWYLVTHPFCRIPCTSNKEDQIKERLWPEVKKWLRGTVWDQYVIVKRTRIYIRGYSEDWFAKIEVASDPDNLAGYHEKYLLYIVDEAAGLEDEFAAVINGAITEENAKVFMIGNPTKRSGYFYDSFHQNSEKWNTTTISARHSRLVSEEWVEEMEDEWGQDSDIVRIRVDGKFPSSESDSFISTDLIEKGFRNLIRRTSGHKILGVDCARFGDDEIVFVGTQGRKMLELESFKKERTTEITGRIIDWIKRKNYDIINIDVGNMGAGVIDQTREKIKQQNLNARVFEIGFGQKPPNKQTYMHNKDMTAFMWRNVKKMLKDDIGLDLIEDQKLKDQFTNRKYKFDSSGRLKLESKEKMKKRGLESPDRADATVLAYLNPLKGKKQSSKVSASIRS